MKNELVLIGAFIPIIAMVALAIYHISTIHGTLQTHEVALQYKDAQIVEIHDHIIYLEEALVNVVITSETNEYRLDLMEEIFD